MAAVGMLYIGLDEAGYGPNLGPLVIGASAWLVPAPTDLAQALRHCVRGPGAGDDPRVFIADSKQVHTAGHGLGRLEQQVLTCHAACEAGAAGARGGDSAIRFLDAWDPDGGPQRARLPWYQTWQQPLPTATEPTRLTQASRSLRKGLADAQVRLWGVQLRSLEPRRFNDEVAATGSKGLVLSRHTLQLLREVLESLPATPVQVVCDKHGGRNQYAGLLQDTFELPCVQICEESRAVSRYRFIWEQRTVDVEFRVGGEAFLPTALASMCAKYHRELAMQAWNQFWITRLPGLRPTAGYPTDARRFVGSIQPLLQPLRIDRDDYWRSR